MKMQFLLAAAATCLMVSACNNTPAPINPQLPEGYISLKEAVNRAIENGCVDSIKVEMRYVGIAPQLDSVFRCTQGCDAYGEYVYFAYYSLNKQDPEAFERDVKVAKYRICEDSLVFVRASKPFEAGHANDIAINPEKGIVYVSTWASKQQKQGFARKELAMLKMDNLEFIGYQSTGEYCWTALEYNSGAGKFFARSGMNLITSDADFNQLNHGLRTDGSIYVTQGLGSDDTYCYFPMSGSRKSMNLLGYYDNVITVYDYDANFYGTIKVNYPEEAESLFVIGERTFINFAQRYGEKGLAHHVYEIMVRE